ncbi:hypothetical protein SLEP1_g18244 [Rubroshorea leprosula]|uniref:Uncharacterized protein n=1 Tax=Rubroshorea leprosula TaxID=152421 RepID=A0AAV5J2R4_9ROSI|nr:hypothetical protein SLEP1_g18244 [Rubroshorea leprosula]
MCCAGMKTLGKPTLEEDVWFGLVPAAKVSALRCWYGLKSDQNPARNRVILYLTYGHLETRVEL